MGLEPAPGTGARSVWWYQKSRQFLGKNKTKLNSSRNSRLSFQIHLCWCLIVKRLMQALLIVKREIGMQVLYSIGNALVIFDIDLLIFDTAQQSFDKTVVYCTSSAIRTAT